MSKTLERKLSFECLRVLGAILRFCRRNKTYQFGWSCVKDLLPYDSRVFHNRIDTLESNDFLIKLQRGNRSYMLLNLSHPCIRRRFASGEEMSVFEETFIMLKKRKSIRYKQLTFDMGC
jgi:hypothetical protein